MSTKPLRSALVALGAIASAAAWSHGVALAQDGFFFKPPSVTLELRAGRATRTADSDVFAYMTQMLTLEKKDFSGVSYGADAAFRAGTHSDVVLGIGYARSEAPSESRDYVGTDDQPIVQHTSLKSMPLTVGVRLYPFSRGSSVGSYAYIPARLTPYVGAGVGAMHYSLSQDGEFVDTSDLSISADHLESSGTSIMMYGTAGTALWLNQHVGLQGDARYTWARAGMGRDFEGFNDIDLRGFQATAGVAFRF